MEESPKVKESFSEPVIFTSSGKDVIASGTVHTFGSENLEIVRGELKFIFEFKNDSGTPRLQGEALSTTTLKLMLYNFDNPLGAGTNNPIEVGTLQNRKLYITFTVYAFNPSSVKTVHFTFFLGESISG